MFTTGSGLFGGSSGAGVGVVWTPASSNPGLAFSGGNTIVNCTVPSAGQARSNIVATTGVKQFEIVAGGDALVVAGVCPPGEATSNGADTGNCWVKYIASASQGKAHSGTFIAYGSTMAVGDVLGVVMDFGAASLTFYKNGVSMGVAFTGLPASLVPTASAVSVAGSNASRTATIKGAGFTFPIAGATQWS